MIRQFARVACFAAVSGLCHAEIDQTRADDAANTIALINHINYVVETIRTYNNVVVLEQEYKTLSSDNLNLQTIPDEDVLRLINQILDALHGMRMADRQRKHLQHVLTRDLDAVKLECALKSAQNMLTAATSNSSGGDLFGVSAIAGMAKTLAVSAAASAMECAVNYTKLRGELKGRWEDAVFELDTKKLDDLAALNKELINAEWGLIKKYHLDDRLRVTGTNVRSLAQCLKNPSRQRAYRVLLPMEKVFAVYPTYWYYRGLLALECNCYDDAISSADTFNRVNRGLFRKDPMAAGVAMVEISAMLSANKVDKEKVRQDLQVICDQNYDSSNPDYGIFAAMVYSRVLDDDETALSVLDPVAFVAESRIDSDLIEYCDLYKKPERSNYLPEPNSVDLTRCRMLRLEIDKKCKKEVDIAKLKEVCARETTSSIEKLFYFGQVRVNDLWKLAVHDIRCINMRIATDEKNGQQIVLEIPVRWFLLGDMPVEIEVVRGDGKRISIAEREDLRDHADVKPDWRGVDESGIGVRLSYPIKSTDLKGLSYVSLRLNHASWPVEIAFEPNDAFDAKSGCFRGESTRLVQVSVSGFMGVGQKKEVADKDELTDQKKVKREMSSVKVPGFDRKGKRHTLNKSDIALRVNGKVLTKSQIDDDVQRIAKAANIPDGQMEYISKLIGKQTAQAFIVENVLVAAAKESGLVVTDEDRKAREREFLASVSKMPGPPKSIKEHFANFPLGETRARAEFENGILIDKLIRAAQSKVVKSDADYTAKAKEIVEKAMCSNKDGAKSLEKALDRIRKIKRQLDLVSQSQLESEFARLAKKCSECPSSAKGGDLGEFTHGQMVKEFDKVAFSLPVGQVSYPVRTVFGYHLILVTKRGSAESGKVCASHILVKTEKCGIPTEDEAIANLKKQDERAFAAEFIKKAIMAADIEASEEYSEFL